jgi:lambda family phage portal protein
LDDIKDYEESERIAARIAAAFTAYIKRNGEYETPLNDDGSRAFEMSPGMIYDNLLPGEDVGMIKSDRPNAGLENFRNGQLRAVAAGTGTRFSSISKNYNGTYSAQRQELVEGGLGYRRLFNTLLHHFYWPIWRTFIDAAILSGALRIPGGIDLPSVYRPEFRPPALPWIDPKKELDAFKTAVECGFKSRHQVIRDMGGDPSTVDQQLAADDFDYRPGQTTGPLAVPADDTIQEEAA